MGWNTLSKPSGSIKVMHVVKCTLLMVKLDQNHLKRENYFVLFKYFRNMAEELSLNLSEPKCEWVRAWKNEAFCYEYFMNFICKCIFLARRNVEVLFLHHTKKLEKLKKILISDIIIVIRCEIVFMSILDPNHATPIESISFISADSPKQLFILSSIWFGIHFALFHQAFLWKEKFWTIDYSHTSIT